MNTAPPADDRTAHRLAVLGAGVMGVGITTLALLRGLSVLLIDIDDARLDRARARIDDELRMAQLMGRFPSGTAVGELVTDTSVDGVADATTLIEATTEDLDIKAKVLAEVSERIRPGTPLVSNTSSIPIDELAGFVQRPAEVVGTHFMNPPYLIRTVEVIRGA